MALSFKKSKKQDSESAQSVGPDSSLQHDASNETTQHKKAKKTKRIKAVKAPKAKGKRFIFFVGDDGCILVFMDGNKVVRRLFAPSAQLTHTEAMLELMRINSTVPIYILADVLDQQYIPQLFPPVNAMSVGGLVKRRLGRDFAADDLKNYILLGRDHEGRKEWRCLLIGLSNTPIISSWIDLLINLPNELKGIYLVPVETANYIQTLNGLLGNSKPNSWQLLISHNKVSGFRQVVLKDHKLVFTRVSQAIDDAVPAVVAGNVEQEITNTLEYIKRLDFKTEAELDVTVVVAQDVSESLDLRRFGFGFSQVLTPLHVAETFELEQAALSADRFGDVVMAAAFGVSKKKQLRFANAYMDRLQALYKSHLAVKALTGLIVLAMIGLSVMSGIGAFSANSEISKIESQASEIALDLKKQRLLVDSLNKDVTFQSAVVTTSDVYLKSSYYPSDMAKLIAPLTTPTSRITSFNWEQADTKAKNTSPTNALPISLSIEVDFDKAGSTPELVGNAAEKFLLSLQSKLPDYEVSHQAYPWVLAQGSTEQLDLAQASNLPVEKKRAIYEIRGPKNGARK